MGSPLSLRAYYKNTEGYSNRIRGVLSGGTHIKFLFDGTTSTSPGAMGYPFFQILNGPYKGFVVDGTLVSILGQAGIFVAQPNPRIMRPTQQTRVGGKP